jgi:hypothetical protein
LGQKNGTSSKHSEVRNVQQFRKYCSLNALKVIIEGVWAALQKKKKNPCWNSGKNISNLLPELVDPKVLLPQHWDRFLILHKWRSAAF